MQLLLKGGADPNASWEGCGTVLQIAALTGNESIVKQLLQANADVNLSCRMKIYDANNHKV